MFVLIRSLLRKIFLDDWGMKLVALGITLALWLGVTGLSSPTTTRISGIPLNIRYSNSSELTNSPIQEIAIVISGDKRKIDQINKANLNASLDLIDTPVGERVISLSAGNVTITGLPSGIKLDDISPNRVAIKLETVEEKRIPVKTLIEGKLADGYEIYSETIIPQTINVRGPSSHLQKLENIATEAIDISGQRSDFVAKQVPINISKTKTSILDQAVVDVSFKIGEKRIERLVTLSNEEGRRVRAVLFGPRTLLNELDTKLIVFSIAKNDKDEDIAQIELPEEISNLVEVRSSKIIS